MKKRIFDILGASMLLIVTSPLLLLVALAVALDSPGGVFFRQQRVGLGGAPFAMLKFRSMVADAPQKGPYFTAKGDPRITKVGAFIRRTSLDELPQLINVLKGDMSLVGPRPDVPAQRQQYRDTDWALRCSARPGITGLAQATERSEATFESRLAYDLEYVRKQSIGLDFKILLMTLRQLASKGSF